MIHPPVEELLGGGPGAREHLDTCPACRRVVALADDPEAPRPVAVPDAFPADELSRARYTDWRALGGGGGGMGRTFRAFDARLGREVVIKQPRGRELRARFEREALLTARLQHPAIVGVYEAGRFDDSEPFYAMPLVRGAPLADEIARRTTADERLALLPHVTAVCEAVAYAHEQGIVHRDLKPANVLVGSFGETVVIDWGLATDLHARDGDAARASLEEVGDGLTQLGVGTPHYMPPEQALGGPADPRMDVYALGATLYHTLAGTPPYGALATAQVRPRLLAEPPAALASVAPTVAPALCDIVARAMAREPAARFASARELAEELRRFQTGRLVQSRRYTPGEIVRHLARRYRAPLSVAAVAAGLLAGVAIISAVRVTRAGNAAQAAQRRAEANERASREELHRGMGVAASRLALLPTRRGDALALAVGAVAPALAAGESPVAEARQGLHDAIAGAAALVLEGHAAPLEGFAFSPDGAHVAGRSPGDHSVQLWDARTGRHLATVAAGGAHFAVDELVFSPDGARLLTWARTPPQAQLWPVTVDAPVVTLDHDGSLERAGFLADGTVVLAGRGLTYLDASGAVVQREALAAPPPGADVADWAARPGRVDQLDAATRATLRTLDGPPGLAVQALALGPRQRLAVATESAAWLVDARAGEAGVLVGHTSEVSGIVVVDGRVISVGLDGRVITWDAGGDVASASAVDSEVLALAADGRRLVVGRTDGVASVFDVGDGGRLVRGPDVAPAGHAVSALAAADGGRRIAFARNDGEILLVDPAARDAVVRMRAPSEPSITALAFAPDASTVASVDVTGRVELWDPVRSTRVAEHVLPPVDDVDRAHFAVAFAGPSRLLAWRYGGDTVALRLPALDADVTLPGRIVAVSPDGARVVTAGASGDLDVHDSGRAPRRVLTSPRPVTSAVLSPDASVLAVGDADGVVRVVDLVADGAATLELASPGGAVSALRFTADGRELAAGHADGVLRLHPLASADALARACRSLTLLGRAEPGCVSGPDGTRAPRGPAAPRATGRPVRP